MMQGDIEVDGDLVVSTVRTMLRGPLVDLAEED